MSPSRRTFLRSAAVAGAGLALPLSTATAGFGPSHPGTGTSAPGARPAAPETRPGDSVERAPRALKTLVLGGTGLIGPPMVEYLLARGHEVTIFNRGRTHNELFPDVERLLGDRNDNLSTIESEVAKGRRWDVVFDNNATLPRWVRQTAQLLKGSADRYIHVSTISVYAETTFRTLAGHDVAPGSEDEQRYRMDEDAPLAKLPDDYDGTERVTGYTYGPFKWMAENEALEAFPNACTVVRPGLIVGPGDTSDRFTYWPVRISRGAEVVVPGTGHDSVQFIDTRDLAPFIVRLAENGVSGTFNGTGPEARLSMAEMVYGIRAVFSTPVKFTWIDADFLAERGVNPWAQMPVWIPGDPQSYVRIDRALANGLTYRPLADTARDTLAWYEQRPADERARMRAGLTPEKEAEVLAQWKGR